MLYQSYICPSACLSDTLVICEHTFPSIETILVSFGKPQHSSFRKCKFGPNLSLLTPPNLGVLVHCRHNEKTTMLVTPGD